MVPMVPGSQTIKPDSKERIIFRKVSAVLRYLFSVSEQIRTNMHIMHFFHCEVKEI